MKIAYHNPHPTTINAYRTISEGFKNAFIDLGHDFRYLTPDDDFKIFFSEFKPDLFITRTHFLYQKYIDHQYLNSLRNDGGLKVFAGLNAWDLPTNINQQRASESKVMKNNLDLIESIKKGYIADAFIHVIEHWDQKMIGFEETTGYKYHTVPLAVDKTLIKTTFKKEFEADISFIGTNSPDKKLMFLEKLFPLKRKYSVNLYGQDWTFFDRMLGWVQRGGQYFNIPYLKSIRKPKLKLEDEGNIYKSSNICINLHEKNQIICGGDCNERTFKIPAFGGFQIVDDVECIRDYFEDGKEIIIAKDKEDWFNKIDYYMNHPDEREKIIEAGRERALKDHTYHNRVEQIIHIYNGLK